MSGSEFVALVFGAAVFVMYFGGVIVPLAAYCETMRCGVAALVIQTQVAARGGNTAAAPWWLHPPAAVRQGFRRLPIP